MELTRPVEGALSGGPTGTLVLGHVSPPDLAVTVNGRPVQKASGGGFLGYVTGAPGAAVARVEARRPQGGELLASQDVHFRLGGFVPGGDRAVDPESLVPVVAETLEPGDSLPVYFQGVPGLTGTVRLGAGLAEAKFQPGLPPDRNYLDLTWEPLPPDGAPLPLGTRAAAEAGPGVWYHAMLRVPPPAPARGWEFGRSAPLTLTFSRQGEGGAQTLQLPGPVTLRDPAVLGEVELSSPNGHVIALSDPDGAYSKFFANGTRGRVGRTVGTLLELRLDGQLSMWVEARDAHPLPGGTLPPRSLVYAVRTQPLAGGWTRLLVRMDQPFPVQVQERPDARSFLLTFYGTRSELEFLRMEPSTSFVRRYSWNQEQTDRMTLEVGLGGTAWGYRSGFVGTDFYLDIKSPPRLAGGSVFRGLTVAVDPGHGPDDGALGPTGLLEKDVNWAVSRRLVRALEAAGARVVVTRHELATAEEYGLTGRVQRALAAGADLLISVHHNAVPNNVNPLLPGNALGSSVYFYQPQSQPLAESLERELLRGLGLPDRGLGLADLGMCRPSELPAVLTEAAFLTVPEQEEQLRTSAFQEREARALFDGLRHYLEGVREAQGR